MGNKIVISRTVFIITFMAINSAWAACDIAKYDTNKMREAYNQFHDEPNSETASLFFKFLPDKFCEFNGIYGYVEGNSGPLYELQLHDILDKLDGYIEVDRLASKYVSLASEGQWDADNVNFLHEVYRELIIQKPEYVVLKVMSLPEDKRKNAMVFLFNSFHPSNEFMSGNEKKNICYVSKQFCEELSLVEKELLADEIPH